MELAHVSEANQHTIQELSSHRRMQAKHCFDQKAGIRAATTFSQEKILMKAELPKEHC